MKDAKKKAREMFKKKAKEGLDYSDKMPKPKMQATVAADSAEGLQKGLSMAEKLMQKRKDYSEGMKARDGGVKKDKGYSEGGLKPSNDSPDTSNDKEDSLKEKLRKRRQASMAVRG